MKHTWRRTAADLAVVFFGAGLMALSVNLFLRPNGTVPGGVTGLAMMGHALWPAMPIGVLILLLNLPLFWLSTKLGDKRLLWMTLYGTVCNSVLIDVTALFLPPVEADPVLAAVFGGLLTGLGLGLVFLRGATTGGSDIAARLLRIPFPHLSVGKLILTVDACVIALSVVVFGSLGHALYAVVTLFVSTRVIDMVLYGPEAAGVAYVISDSPERVAAALTAGLGRGTTLLHGQGGRDAATKKVILCAAHRTQLPALRRIVAETDPAAFVIVTEAHEVRGEGFKPIETL